MSEKTARELLGCEIRWDDDGAYCRTHAHIVGHNWITGLGCEFATAVIEAAREDLNPKVTALINLRLLLDSYRGRTSKIPLWEIDEAIGDERFRFGAEPSEPLDSSRCCQGREGCACLDSEGRA
jgi:hypothetical protein